MDFSSSAFRTSTYTSAKSSPPSKWNPDHRGFYTPATLMIDIEGALEPNTYRLRHLIDNDAGYGYSIPPDVMKSNS
jgi:hypothetical protein